VGAPGGSPANPELLDRLRAFRREQATREAVPAYVIFNDRTLDEIARVRPPDLEALAAIHGLGTSRVTRYGTGILDVLRGDETDARRCS
jgi:ATP-dependent DNA helicase RecQ